MEKVEKDGNCQHPYLRVGWANTTGFSPYPVGGDFYGENGVGDDAYSFGFDGINLWTGIDFLLLIRVYVSIYLNSEHHPNEGRNCYLPKQLTVCYLPINF